MQLNIEKHNFCKLDGIANIKNHLEKISNVKLDEGKATGRVEINIAYNDFEGLECFKVLDFPFELDLEKLKILEVLLGKTEVYIVEGQGMDIHYELVINYLPLEDKEIEIEIIDEAPIPALEEKSLEEIKEDISEYYEDKLADNLARDDTTVLVTKGHKDPTSFLDFFDSKAGYYKLKCLYVTKEEELNQISKEYNVPLETLIAGYDRETHKVIFSLS